VELQIEMAMKMVLSRMQYQHLPNISCQKAYFLSKDEDVYKNMVQRGILMKGKDNNKVNF
jgi:hypothetical protein